MDGQLTLKTQIQSPWKDGTINVDGPRTHVFYTGKVNGGKFKNFEYKAKVFLTPGFKLRPLFSYPIR